LCKEWAARIAEEYFSQTKEEKQKKLHVVFPDFDRQTCNLPATQVKFIDYFANGLFGAWNHFSSIPKLMENLSYNYEHWKLQYDSPSSSEAETEAQS
jgi:high affinity cAMP-specific and IBMX-insensitive 3',5'-cyclic phosphodiesterase 8